MVDNKLTYDEIVTALKGEIESIEATGGYFCYVHVDLMKETLVSIMRLKLENNHLQNDVNALEILLERANAEIDRLKLEMSYMKSPNTIGDSHEMGAW